MKKNLSGIILISEIVAITLFHAIKIHQAEQQADNNITSTSIFSSSNIKAKLPYLFVNMLK